MNITLTEAAAEKVKELIAEEDNPNLKLRIGVSGGGCSGLNYVVSFDEDVDEEEDFQIEQHGITLLVDVMSAQYLADATIDFSESVYGASFSINNPAATSTCGCGSSFSM
jgi:iron-sulfur cluster insertion protein